uniref:Myb/SANT-like domain-containing protein n=1 Tax=Lactuca sativa TaxID=4236 RepID=A0A9R1UFL4_LACSA|nr:hypothetical protein LSAT_V11C900486660 [Lactuca sativa]
MTGRNKHTWTTEEDAKLIEALLELHVSRKYGGADNGFKPGYLKAVQQLLDVSLPNSGLKAEPHMKSRMKTWKNHFKIVYDMVDGTNTSGFGWDTDKCCVHTDAEVWDEYIKDRPTGHGATGPGEDATEETQRNSHVDVEGLEDIVEETQQIALGNNKRKRPPTDDTESSYKDAAKDMKETFKEVGEKLNETIYNIGRQENKEACDMIDKVIKDIVCMPNIIVKQRIKAIDMFNKDQFRARAFFKMIEEEKICYMEMIGYGSIS